MSDVYHKNLVDADLHPAGYRQDSDPGAVGAGVYWIDSSGGTGQWTLYVRNAADDDWEQVSSNANGETLQKDINQSTHGLSVGDVIRFESGTGYVKALADGESDARVIGVVSAVADVDNFTLIVNGYISGLSGLTTGAQYYLDPSTAGAITSTKPTTASQIAKAILIAISATEAYVNVQDSHDAIIYDTLSELTDTAISGLTNNQILRYNNGTGKWENSDETAGVTTLAALTDVTISGATNGQVLTYDNGTSKWINQDVVASGGTFETAAVSIKTDAYTLQSTDKGKLIVANIASGFSTDYKLMLNLNGTDGATTTTDQSPSAHSVTFNGNAQLDTADKKFGTASCQFDGTGDYLTMADSADWDLFGSTVESWNLDFWVKHTDYTGSEMYMTQHENASNAWQFYHVGGSGMTLYYVENGSTRINLTGAGQISDTNWHHVALCIVNGTVGIYIDGVQTGYATFSVTDTFAGTLYVGIAGTLGAPFDGHIDAIRLRKNNAFSANPVVGLTDTIVVPTAEDAGSVGEITFPDISGDEVYMVKNINSSPLTLTADGSDTIEISSIGENDGAILAGDGTNNKWRVIANIGESSSNTSACGIYLNSNQLNIANSTPTKVALDTEWFDTLSEFDNTTNYRFTAAAAGIYSVKAQITYTNTTADKLYTLRLYKNGSLFAVNYNQTSLVQNLSVSMSIDIQLSASEYLELYAWHADGGSTVDLLGESGGEHFTYMTVKKLA